MRVGEVLALQKEDVDLKYKTININKTLTRDKNDKIKLETTTKTYAGTRKIPIPTFLVDILDSLVDNSERQLFEENNKLNFTFYY